MNSCSRGKPPEVIRESQLALKVLGMSLKEREREREEPTQTADGKNTAKKHTISERARKANKRSVCTSKFKCQLWTAANSVKPPSTTLADFRANMQLLLCICGSVLVSRL